MAKRTLVIFPGALGDFICFLPALEKLARCGGVDLLARSEYGDLIFPTVTVRSVECREITQLFVPGADQDERLKCFFGSYASIYSWMGSGQWAFVRHLQTLSHGRLGIFPFRPPQSRVHMADYYLSCVGEKNVREIFPIIRLRSDALTWGRRFWQQSVLEKKRVLMLAPGSGAKEKNWPIDFYKAVAGWWKRRTEGEVIVILGPVEVETGETEDLDDRALVVRGLNLAQLASLLLRCHVYLGNDSGVTHMAAALGVETIALFGPSDPVQWAPRGRNVTVITQGVPCSPCAHSVMKACPHRQCLTQLSPHGVLGFLEEVVEKFPDVGTSLTT
jgi:ADP-heptose:LPS heptosyltransferase